MTRIFLRIFLIFMTSGTLAEEAQYQSSPLPSPSLPANLKTIDHVAEALLPKVIDQKNFASELFILRNLARKYSELQEYVDLLREYRELNSGIVNDMPREGKALMEDRLFELSMQLDEMVEKKLFDDTINKKFSVFIDSFISVPHKIDLIQDGTSYRLFLSEEGAKVKAHTKQSVYSIDAAKLKEQFPLTSNKIDGEDVELVNSIGVISSALFTFDWVMFPETQFLTEDHRNPSAESLLNQLDNKSITVGTELYWPYFAPEIKLTHHFKEEYFLNADSTATPDYIRDHVKKRLTGILMKYYFSWTQAPINRIIVNHQKILQDYSLLGEILTPREYLYLPVTTE